MLYYLSLHISKISNVPSLLVMATLLYATLILCYWTPLFSLLIPIDIATSLIRYYNLTPVLDKQVASDVGGNIVHANTENLCRNSAVEAGKKSGNIIASGKGKQVVSNPCIPSTDVTASSRRSPGEILELDYTPKDSVIEDTFSQTVRNLGLHA